MGYMNCLQQIRRHKRSRNRQAQLAKKMARIDNAIYILFKRQNGEYSFIKKGTEYKGEFVEEILP